MDDSDPKLSDLILFFKWSSELPVKVDIGLVLLDIIAVDLLTADDEQLFVFTCSFLAILGALPKSNPSLVYISFSGRFFDSALLTLLSKIKHI